MSIRILFLGTLKCDVCSFGYSLGVRSEKKSGDKDPDSLTRIASRITLEALHVSTMSSCLSIATPSSDADSLNLSWRRRNDTLPYEILSAIFSYISHDHILHLRHLLFVCRSWNFVILQEAELWSTIRIDGEIHQYFNDAQAADFVSLCISRSRSHPLSIMLDFGTFVAFNPVDTVRLRRSMIPLLRILIGHLDQHALRWRSLEWHNLSDVPEILSILPPHLPQLKCVRFYGGSWNERPEIIFPHCPNLEVVELHENEGFDVRLFGECHVHTVTELLVESDLCWISEEVDCIAGFRNVRRLTLSSPTGCNLDTDGLEKIHLPQLEALRLLGGVCPNLVSLLSAPSLSKVEIDHYESIFSVVSYLVSTDIETIAILIPPRDFISHLPYELIDLITSLHGLRTLRVNRWIYDVITAGDSPLNTSALLGLRLIIED